MAKKKEQGRQYLQSPLPQGQKYYSLKKISWSGMNLRQELDTGELSMESNISTDEAPYLTPCEMPAMLTVAKDCISNNGIYYPYYSDDSNPRLPIGLFCFSDLLYVVFMGELDGSYATILDVVSINDDGNTRPYKITNSTSLSTGAVNRVQHSIVNFNKYSNSIDSGSSAVTGVTNAQYDRVMVMFPERMTIEVILDIGELDSLGSIHVGYDFTTGNNGNDYLNGRYHGFPRATDINMARYNNKIMSFFRITNDDRTIYYLFRAKAWVDNEGNHITYTCIETSNDKYPGAKLLENPEMPDMDYATVFQSRLFGVGNGRVYASGYNDYANWQLDTSSSFNSSNAWMSASQSNTKAGGEFTGITTFGNHVIAFKKDFVHEITNTKNPFRIVDVFACGTIDNRSVQDVNGTLIFVSSGNVYAYTGSAPRDMGYKLGIDKFSYAVSGTDGRRYYLYCEDGDDTDENGYGKGHFFVYDSYFGAWSERSLDPFDILGIAEEDPSLIPKTRFISFANSSYGMLVLCQNGYIFMLNTDNYSDTAWSFETDLITRLSGSSAAYGTENIKHIRKVQMLADVAEDAYFKVYALYNGEAFDSKASQLLYDSSARGRSGRVAVRVKLRRSANYSTKLHFEGHGYVKLYELELLTEAGGDLYVEN